MRTRTCQAGFPSFAILLFALNASAAGKAPPPCEVTAPPHGEALIVTFEGFSGYDAAEYERVRALKEPPPLQHQENAPGKGQLLRGMIEQGVLQISAHPQWYYFDENKIQSSSATDFARCITQAQKESGAPLVLMGFSYGGHATMLLTRQLAELGTPIALVITADPVKRFPLVGFKFEKGPHIGKWLNFYQHNDWLIRGSSIPTADQDVNLSPQGYTHFWMPGTDEVTRAVREELHTLYQQSR